MYSRVGRKESSWAAERRRSRLALRRLYRWVNQPDRRNNRCLSQEAGRYVEVVSPLGFSILLEAIKPLLI